MWEAVSQEVCLGAAIPNASTGCVRTLTMLRLLSLEFETQLELMALPERHTIMFRQASQRLQFSFATLTKDFGVLLI